MHRLFHFVQKNIVNIRTMSTNPQNRRAFMNSNSRRTPLSSDLGSLEVVKPMERPMVPTLNESHKKLAQLRESLYINEEFKRTLIAHLDPKNFKNIAYKQKEIDKFIWKMKNPSYLYFLLEKFHPDFNHLNVVTCFDKLYKTISADSNISVENHFVEDQMIPKPIKSILSKLIFKHIRHFEPLDCYKVFHILFALRFPFSDFSYDCVFQILKYHVNDLNMRQLQAVKYKLNIFRINLPNNQENEFLNNLEKAVNLAIQIKKNDK